MSVRLFIAVELNDAVRRRLADIQAELDDVRACIKWVKPENAHLTLVFIGDVPDAMAAPIAGVMDRVAADTRPFALRLAGAGFFGRSRAPRVLWIGARGDLAAVTGLQARLAEALQELELALDPRPYRPHLTLGRVKGPSRGSELVQRLTSLQDAPCGTLDVRRIALIKSTLHPQGPVYTMLHAARFPGPE
ncbi:MAG: RNA 2',3'-cyclic phosphodiesterase [Phycisphaerae bacterium]|nr:RNA 2',3'-cyclic phosphodiesterase [Phycisphaerae bacterium]